MGKVVARLSHKSFEFSNIKNFSVKISNNTVKLEKERGFIEIKISGHKNNEKIKIFFFELISMMFIYLGSFPKIEELKIGDEKIDINKYANKFISDSYFERRDSYICEISEETICEEKYNEFKKIPQLPIYSMQYLISKFYRQMNIVHKMTLLTHIIDGVAHVPTNKKQLKANLRAKYNIPLSVEVGDYLIQTDIVMTPFFKLHSKYNCEIIIFFGKNRYNFLKIISDTRNWYSHFLKKTQKIDRLKNGMEMVIFFELIIFCLRIYLCETMKIKLVEDNVKEYLYTIHDWILEIKYNKNAPLKSKTYRINRSMREMEEQLKELAQNHLEEYFGTE